MWFTPLLQGGAQQQAGGVTIYRPSSDITVTGWIGVPDNVNLYNNIDETAASDADYVVSPSLAATPGPAIFGLNGTLGSGSCIVRVRSSYGGTSGQIRVLLQDSSGVTVGTSSWQVLTATPTTYNLNVTTTGTAARARLEVQP